MKYFTIIFCLFLAGCNELTKSELFDTKIKTEGKVAYHCANGDHIWSYDGKLWIPMNYNFYDTDLRELDSTTAADGCKWK